MIAPITHPPLPRDRATLEQDLLAAGCTILGTSTTCPLPDHPDAHPSASIYADDRGAWRVKCHGCGWGGDVFDLRALLTGKLLADVLREARNGEPAASPPSPPAKVKPSIVTTYPYTDETGELLFEAVRFEPKDFRQRKPNGRGGWTWKLGDVRRVLYRLPQLITSGPGTFVFVVEGEKDADRLIDLGLVSTTAPMGAGKWCGVDDEALRDRHVVLLPDNDKAGRDHAEQVAALIRHKVASVRVLPLPDLPPKGDVSDWLDAGGDVEVLLAMAEAAPLWTPTPAEAPAKAEPRRLSTPNLIRMSDVEPADIKWLWPGRIPLGRITLLAGRPGDGKSFLTAYLAAIVSRGRSWIDGTPCPVGSVVLCSAEDDPADTIAPRLIAHEADRERVHLLAGVMTRAGDKEVEHIFTLADLDALRQTLELVSDCRLIVIDPIGSYLGGQVDAHRDNDVRAVLAPVCQLAAQYGAAVVVVCHTRKAAAANADDMVMGSRAFTGLARSSLHLLIDPDDESKQRRLLLPGKNNLAERPAGLAFDIGPGDIDGRPCVRWIDCEVSITADEAVNREAPRDNDRRTERDEAADWLRQALAAGARPANDITEEAREAEGIAKRTLDRARKEVGVEAYRPENPGPWWWRLPPAEAQRHNT